MDKTIRKAVSFEEQKADYLYWQSVTPSERARCGLEIAKWAYQRKGLYCDGQRLDRTAVALRALRGARPQDIADVEAIRTAQRVVSSYRKNTRQ